MLIILLTYAAIVWAVFFRYKLLPWNWISGITTVIFGCAILAFFVALLNTLTPSGRFAVVGRVVEVTPNVSGTVTTIPVEPNKLVKVGTILFKIDPTPYHAKVKQLQASVAEARQKVEQLKAQVALAAADVKGLASQIDYTEKRLKDIEKLTQANAASQFKLQDANLQVNMITAQLQAAKAREVNARLALGSEINGENTTVAQLGAQLENALWELDQTTVRAAGDGYVSSLALTIGARTTSFRSAMSFILVDQIQLVGIFSQNGFKNLKQDDPVRLVFASQPGKVFESKVAKIVRGIGQGQTAISGTLPKTEEVGVGTTYPVTIELPKNTPPELLRLGMIGTATVYTENAGPIGSLATILLWVKAYAAYL